MKKEKFVSLPPNQRQRGNHSRDDQVYETRGDLECCVARRGHRAGGGDRHHLPGVGVPQRQRLGEGGGDPLPLRHAGLVRGIDALPLDQASLEVEGAAEEVGPRGHLLAHRGIVLTADTRRAAHTGLLGLEPLHLRLDLCHSGDHRELYPTEGALEPGDVVLRGHGTERARGLQAADGLGIGCGRHLADRRGCQLHHGSGVLLPEQDQIHAFGIPLFRARGQRLSHHRSLGCADGIPLKNGSLFCFSS